MSPSLARLRAGEWLAAPAAVAMATFLATPAWYGGATARDGWQAVPTLRWLIAGTVLLVLVTVLAQGAMRGPGLSAALDVPSLVLTTVTALLLIVRLATTGAPLRVGAYLGLVASLATAAGAYWALRAEQGWVPGPDRPVAVVSLGPSDDR